MMNIEIVPIFDQSVPHVWDDFVRISAAAMRHVYNYKTSEPERRDAISKLQYNWAHSEYSWPIRWNWCHWPTPRDFMNIMVMFPYPAAAIIT